MGSFIGLNNEIYVAHLNLTGLANEIQFGTITVGMNRSTTFADGGFECFKPALRSADAMVKGFQDWATDILDDDVSIGSLGTQYALTAIPNPTGTVIAADACWMSRGLVSNLNPMSGAKGDMAGFELGLKYDTAIVQAKVLAPRAAKTADFTGTAVAMAGPTASQRLYAAVHVVAYSGFTNCVFKVQSDDAVGFPSATDRITFATVTGVTSEFASVAGSFSSETHHRIFADVTGSGSITFVAVAGVI